MNRARSFPWGHFGTPAPPGPPSQRKGPGNEDGGFHARFFAEHAHFSFTTGTYWTAACFRVWCAYIVRGNLKLTVSFIFLQICGTRMWNLSHFWDFFSCVVWLWRLLLLAGYVIGCYSVFESAFERILSVQKSYDWSKHQGSRATNRRKFMDYYLWTLKRIHEVVTIWNFPFRADNLPEVICNSK